MKLYDFQKQALERTKDFNKVAYYHCMGLGKTFTGAEKLKRLNANVNLVICQKSKVKDWIEHFETHYKNCYVVNDLTNKEQYQNFLTYARVLNKGSSIQHVGVINYDLVFRRAELLKLKEFTLLLDESSMIQNLTAKRTKTILKLNAKNVILLSGTPIAGKYENLYSQLRLLGWEISNRDYWDQFINYRLEYYNSCPFGVKAVTGYKNVGMLKSILKNYGADFIKSEEVLTLPEQNFNVVSCDISKEYTKFMRDKIITINDEELIGDNQLTQLLYARMLCGAYNKDKLQAFSDLITSSNDRFIVFYNFNCELEALLQKIDNRPYSLVNGQVKDLTNYENESNSITFVQYQAGAMGLNLQHKANKMIYFSLPLSSELFEQSKKRIHRIGQKQSCFYYIMMCRGSVEEKIYKTLLKRNDYTQKLFEKDFI